MFLQTQVSVTMLLPTSKLAEFTAREVLLVGAADAGECRHPLTLTTGPLMALLPAHVGGVWKQHTSLFTHNH